MSDLFTVLRRHDAEPDVRLTAEEEDRAEALLRSVTAIDPAPRPVTAVRPQKRHRARGFVLVGAVTAVAAVAGIGVIGSDGSFLGDVLHFIDGQGRSSLSSAEIASWTAVPTSVTKTATVRELVEQCLDQGGNAPVSAAKATVTNLDRRGAVTSFVVDDGVADKRTWCLADSSGVTTSELVEDRQTPLPAVDPAAVNLQTFGGHGSGATATREGYGQVGSDVTSLTITAPGHPAATVAVEDGLWVMWWPAPGLDSRDSGDLRFSWTTSDGATHTGTGDSVYWDAK